MAAACGSFGVSFRKKPKSNGKKEAFANVLAEDNRNELQPHSAALASELAEQG